MTEAGAIPLIHDDETYEAALDEIRRISLADPAPGSLEMQRLDAIYLLAKAYDDRICPWPTPPHPIKAIEAKVRQKGITSAQLALLMGGHNRSSEILNLKRSLNLPMIRRLAKALEISTEILCAPYELTNAPKKKKSKQADAA